MPQFNLYKLIRVGLLSSAVLLVSNVYANGSSDIPPPPDDHDHLEATGSGGFGGLGGYGSGGGGIISGGSGGNGGQVGGSGNGGGLSAEQQRAKEYSECLKRAESSRQPCINERNRFINIAADACLIEVALAAGLGGTYLSPITGIAIGAVGSTACVTAKYADLDRVSGYCANSVNSQKAACG